MVIKHIVTTSSGVDLEFPFKIFQDASESQFVMFDRPFLIRWSCSKLVNPEVQLHSQ